MSEPIGRFVSSRRPRWTRLEALESRAARYALSFEEATELDVLFRQLSTDLAQLQRSHPGSEVERALTQLAARVQRRLTRSERPRLGSLRDFYRSVYPAAVHSLRGPIAVAAALMLFGAVLGALSVGLQPPSAEVLIAPHLRRFIDDGTLWTDSALERTTPAELATMIFLNNLRVIFTAFVLGLTFGVGTVVVLIVNGLQLGAVVVACARGGVGPNVLAFISAHGPIELSMIAIAGGAGLHLAGALIDPKDSARALALRRAGQQSVAATLGSAPFIVAVGMVEGFVSPGAFFPWPVRAAIGLVSFVAFWSWVSRAASRSPAPPARAW